jgi:hypothetical protein
MTVTEILDYVKRLHTENVAQTAFWSDVELYSLLERKCNEMLGVLGLIEKSDTSLISVASQSDYTLPADIVSVRRVYYANQPLKYLNLRQFESRSPQGSAPTGTPREFTIWGGLLKLVPTPSTSADQITIFAEKTQTPITSSAVAIEIPAVFHGYLCESMFVDMFIKDLNPNIATFYLNKVNQFWVPMLREFAKRRHRRGLPTTVIDADSVLETEFGSI